MSARCVNRNMDPKWLHPSGNSSALKKPFSAAASASVRALRRSWRRGALLLEVGEDRLGRRHRQRVLHVRTAEEGGLGLRAAVVAVPPEAAVDPVHDVGAARDRADREAAAERLAVGGEVRDDAEVSCAPRGWGRKPVSISSKSSTMPRRRVRSRSPRTNSTGRRAGLRHCTGSTTTAAMVVAERVDGVQGFLAAVFEDDQLGDGAVRDAVRDGHGVSCRPVPGGRARCRCDRGTNRGT